MKYKVKYENYHNGKEEEPEHETTYGLLVYDEVGNEYSVSLNKFGELEIMGNDGQLIIYPNVSNVIILKQK